MVDRAGTAGEGRPPVRVDGSAAVSTCWKCHEPTGIPVCVSCGTIQPPPVAPDLFALLRIPRRYQLDVAELEARFRDVSRLVHPDRFARHTAVERRMSLQWTAALNTGRRVLKDPLSRAHYMATGRTEPEENGAQVDDDFLEEMFALREQAQSEPEQVSALAQALRNTLLGDLERIFAENEEEGAALDPVEERLARIRYLDGLITKP
jgi:molecular chaperone HscB